MKKALVLSAALAACGNDISLNAGDITLASDTAENPMLPCENELRAGTIPYDRVDPSSFPVDVSFVDEKAKFFEIFSGYRDEIMAVFAVPLAGGDYAVHPVELTREVEELAFTDLPVSFETGDFQAMVDFGSYASIHDAGGVMLITDENCSSLYGYASYWFEGFSPDFTSAMTSYMDENGDIVEL